MADAQPGLSSCCLSFLNEGLILPLRHRSVFLPTLALTGANTGFVDHAYNLALSEALRPNDMAAAYLLAAFAGPTIRAITAAAAIATHTEKHHVSFSALINKALRGGLRASAAATAADGNIMWVARRVGGGAALGFLMVLSVRFFFFLTPLVIELLIALHLAHRLLEHYLATVCTVAVVVSLSEPACHGGMAAIRHAWWLAQENVASSAVLLAANGFLTGVFPEWCADAVERVLDYTTIPACESIVWIVHVLLQSSAAVLGVCAATTFYYQSAKRAIADDAAATPGPGRNEGLSFSVHREMLQGRSTMRRMLVMTLEKAGCLSLQMFAYVATAPLVLYVFAATCTWMATQGTMPFVLLQNDLVSLRSSLRAINQSNSSLRRADRVCPKPTSQVIYSFLHKA